MGSETLGLLELMKRNFLDDYESICNTVLEQERSLNVEVGANEKLAKDYHQLKMNYENLVNNYFEQKEINEGLAELLEEERNRNILSRIKDFFSIGR